MSMPSNRLAAIGEARAERERAPVYLDTETTGMEAADEVVEVCVLDADGVPLFESLVRPTRPVSDGAYRVHRIGALQLRDAPPWRDVWARVEPLLAGKRVGIYNAKFDLTMMRQSHRAHGMMWNPLACDAFCIMELYARFYGQANPGYRNFRWQSLESAGRQCRITLPNAHRAAADARLARAILHYMADSR